MDPGLPIFVVEGFESLVVRILDVLQVLQGIRNDTGSMRRDVGDIKQFTSNVYPIIQTISDDVGAVKRNTSDVIPIVSRTADDVGALKQNVASGLSSIESLLSEILADQVGEITFGAAVTEITAAIAALGEDLDLTIAAAAASVVSSIVALGVTLTPQLTSITQAIGVTNGKLDSLPQSTYAKFEPDLALLKSDLIGVRSNTNSTNTILSNVLTTLNTINNNIVANNASTNNIYNLLQLLALGPDPVPGQPQLYTMIFNIWQMFSLGGYVIDDTGGLARVRVRF